MNVSKIVAEILEKALSLAKKKKYEYVTPEVVLLALCQNEEFCLALEDCGGDVHLLEDDLTEYLDQYLVAEGETEPHFSSGMADALMTAQRSAQFSGRGYVDIDHLIRGIWSLENCYGVYYLEVQDVEEVDMLQALTGITGNDSGVDSTENEPQNPQNTGRDFEQFAPCINDMLDGVNPLIGREEELERTIQILCRKDKNNPIHIGEPGVGKTAITYGLARMIEDDIVPEPLRGARIYSLDLGSLLAGTQYRGDMEKRLKKLLDDISQEENPIIYIDEIHNLAGAGAVGESSFDTSNMLKPYLAQGKIRFIGATTYEEYKKHFEKNKSLVRRFQTVDIGEPSVSETVDILEGLRAGYEAYHGVKYGKGVLEYAVRMSKKYINERYLPDKAIDLMDEAGAYRRIHPLDQKTQTVGKDLINEILTKICRVPIEATKEEKDSKISTLEKRMLAKVYGQDEAISQVVNAIKFSKAGLLEENKPLSSFLFAGPTGVGKTEIAKTLAEEMGIKLVRFDMSEYGEKHTIAKLIGSPAGYVGYEDGGLLTEAIRKNPSCVLLLDEIEKAHSDIYNVLLQVMDYATLTDNQGRKADFRNVIIIMTSNAGASRIGKAGLGFSGRDVTSDVVSEEVKRVFQPEFRNRLNKIVVFRSMDDDMGNLIARKKLGQLADLLKAKNVSLKFTKKAIALLKEKGTSREFGAREMDRIIQDQIKTLLVDELLFGKLKKGGDCKVDASGDEFVLEVAKKKAKKGE